MSGLAGEAFVAIWHDIAPEGLANFYEWHQREHMPERVGIPGFRRGRRYVRVDGGSPRWFNLYEVDRFEVLVGADYLGRLNAPTPWTKDAVVHFRDVTRGLARVRASLGHGQGGAIGTWRFDAAPGREAGLERHLARAALPEIVARARVLGAHLGVTDEAGSRIETAEKKVRAAPTDVPGWIVLVEAADPEAIAAATRDLLSDDALAAAGAAGPARHALHRLESTRLKTAWTAG
jgi:hypothetical protein